MKPHSAELEKAVRGSVGFDVRARLCPAGQTGVNPDGEPVEVVGGSVTFDRSAAVRATADITLDAGHLWPTRVDDLLAPYGGTEIFIERGVRFGGGTEWVPFGYFRIVTPVQKSPTRGAVRVAAPDRMAGVRSSRLLTPKHFPAHVSSGDAVAQLVTPVYPDVVIEWDDDSSFRPLGRDNTASKDRYGFLSDVVSSRGKTLRFDHRGVLVIADPPDPTVPVFTLDTGPGGLITSLGRQLTREGVVNGMVVTGQGADNNKPFWRAAYDADPESPTYWYGRFGQQPGFYNSSFINTGIQASVVARRLLLPKLGLTYSVDLSAVPVVFLDPEDVVTVSHPALDETHVLQQVRASLNVDGSSSLKTKEQTRTLIGDITDEDEDVVA